MAYRRTAGSAQRKPQTAKAGSAAWPSGRKTFTGCWTCRARRLKCDETYPHCNQCTRKNLACEGYSTRLQWLPCDTGTGSGAAAMSVRTTTSQRRQISFSIPSSVFSDPELDKLLVDIDDDALNRSQARRQGPFGVFAAQRAQEEAAACRFAEDHHIPTSEHPPSRASPPSSGLPFKSSEHQQLQGRYEGVLDASNINVAIDDVSHVELSPFGTGDVGGEPEPWVGTQYMWSDFPSGALSTPEPVPTQSNFLDMLAASAPLDEPAVVPAVSATAVVPKTGLLATTGGRGTAMDWDSPRGLLGGFSPAAVSIPSPSTLTANLLELLEAQEALNNAPGTASASVSTAADSGLCKDLVGGNSGGDNNKNSTADAALSSLVLPPTLIHQPCAFFAKPETRFLLNYYVQNVIESFCMVANNSKSPWKSIHLPRALQGTGELEVMGETSHARNALLNSLLSVSAYCLSNRYGCKTAEQENWRKVGYQRRFQAVRALQMGLAENMTSTDSSGHGIDHVDSRRGSSGSSSVTSSRSMARPKYKELLAAMLSMISIDVASGETATTHMHLLGCESLIRSTKGWKRRYSSKARALHRIFYYLRVIYATTNPVDILEEEPTHAGTTMPTITNEAAAAVIGADTATSHVAGGGDGPTSPATSGSNNKDRNNGGSVSNARSNRSGSSTTASSASGSPSANDHDTRVWLEENLNDYSETATSCEFIYGVPASLLTLLSRVTILVNKVERMRRSQAQGNTIDLGGGDGLDGEADRLEAEILDFPVDTDTTPAYAAFLATQAPADRMLIQHQIKAFHRAVLIYFSQNVRSMHATFLRPYVEDVIAHAEAIEALKQEHRVASGTLYWPCFIAAGEALDEVLQQRFVRWYKLTSDSGFAACLRGQDVVYEVWRRRQSGCSRQRSSWRRVTEAQKICLMLT